MCIRDRIFDVDSFRAEDKEEKSLIGTVRNVSKEQKREKILQEQVKRDSMTKLYNHFFGKELINEYLNNKTPYASCGMMVVDIDYFKAVNDSFGPVSYTHLDVYKRQIRNGR